MRCYILFALFILSPYYAFSNDGDLFSAKTAEGIDMIFKVISETDKTCQVGSGNSYEPAISTRYSGSVTVPSTANGYTVVGIGNYSLCYSSSNLSSINLPNSITYIGNSAFNGCSSLTSINLPNSVTEIGERAFYGCTGMKSLELPSNLTSIGKYAFYSCRSLASIIIPNFVTEIGERTFADCISLASIKLSNSLKKIQDGAFSECVKLEEIEIPNSVTSIGSGALASCTSLSRVVIPNSVSSLGKYGVFNGCSSLKEVILSNRIKTIPELTFSGCSSLEIITLPNSVTTFGNRAFAFCTNLASVSMPNSLISIGEKVFQECSSLTSITIPKTVTSIGKHAFLGCTNLNVVKSEIQMPSQCTMGAYVFESIGNNRVLYVPHGTKDLYLAIPEWKYYFGSNIIEESTSYNLTIVSIGNGSASYNGSTIRSTTSSFMVNEGSSVTITFASDNGYRIKSVKVNSSDVTSSVSNNQYTISSINKNTNVEVEFEAIPPTTYTLSIKATGNGSASYNGNTIRSKTSTFTVNEGTSATITFVPDNGYRIKSLKVNNSDVTLSLSSNKYTISSINKNTTVEVEFEAIPATTYTLSIKATGSGSVSYNGTTIRSKTSTFTVNEGTSATITFAPDNGYRIKSVKVNSSDVTANISNNKYTISNINKNTTVEVEFEAIPPTTYTLSIKATGNGSASYSGTTIRGKTSTFTVNEGSNAAITFAPDNGYRIKSVKVNNADVTSSLSNNSYTINNISKNTNVEVEFEAIPATTYTLSITASGNGFASYDGTTIRSKTSTFTVNEGANASIIFTPDNGYRIKSVKENNTIVTSYVSGNTYTISSISRNTTVEVEFEAVPPTIYTLSIKATGNGSASYDGTIIRSKTSTFTVNEGTNVTISFAPDNGYRIKSVKVNNADVTSSVSNNSYTISDISRDTNVEVEFEAVPATTYTLSITASGNGSASYNGTSIRSKTSTFTVNEGTNVSITFTPDNGYRIKSVKENNTIVTSYVSNNTYKINSISRNTTVEVEFEAIPQTTYTLTIAVSGGGSVYYEGETINNSTNYYTVNDGTYATIYFTPDDGYRLKSVKENYYDVTSQIGSNSYTTYISGNTSIEVEFEEISVSTYSLSVKASGSGSVSYNGSTVRNRTTSFTVEEGTNATITFTPDNGYRLKSVVVNNYNVTSSVSNNSYTISYINRDTNVEVEFEAIPATTYTLSVKAVGSGSASYNGTIVRDKTSTFSVNEGTNATITFTPDNGYRIKSLVVNNADVTSYISNNTYSINSIAKNTTLVVEFEAEPSAFAVNGVNYTIRSNSEKTVAVSRGNYGAVLDVPAKVTYQNAEWKVTSIESNALSSSPDLCAIIWNPEVAFTENVRNPNLLLYVKSEDYAPTAIKNVVVNGSASSITLTDAASGNNFYCPEEFTVKSVSYTHHYTMDTGLGESKGWETIALPFDVQKISHQSKGEIVPFANWKSGDSKKPFWLMELGNSGWSDASSIKAYTPYIISMPNHEKYKADYKLNGNVTFSAANVKIGKTQNYSTSSYGGKTFVPNYSLQTDRNCLALNVNNDYITYQGSDWGSKFSSGRDVHPFEAYMTTASGARSIAIADDMMTTGIHDIMEMIDEEKVVRVYNLKGQLIKIEDGKTLEQVKKTLPAGVYIINGQKLVIK